MAANFPLGDKELKIGILGFTPGNGHPYSWSAMFNNYNHELMEDCGFPVIPRYLEKQPVETIGIPGAKITHICCTGFKDIEEARKIAAASKIEHVCVKPEEMIGEVDAVICATDLGDEHVERCRPFLEAGIPMFIDKPLVNKEEDLRTFLKWRAEGKKFLSSSSMRYGKAVEPYYKNHYEFGELKFIIRPMAKYLQTYGIHALENVYPLLDKGFTSVRWMGDETTTTGKSTLYIEHKSGCVTVITQDEKLNGTGMIVMGSEGSAEIKDGDSYYSFKKQLDVFVHWLRTGEEPFEFYQTVELMKILVGGIQSRAQGGKKIMLKDIVPEFNEEYGL